MPEQSTLYDEKYMRYIQQTLKVSRREIIETISLSKTSAEEIAKYLQKKMMGIKRVGIA